MIDSGGASLAHLSVLVFDELLAPLRRAWATRGGDVVQGDDRGNASGGHYHGHSDLSKGGGPPCHGSIGS